MSIWLKTSGQPAFTSTESYKQLLLLFVFLSSFRFYLAKIAGLPPEGQHLSNMTLVVGYPHPGGMPLHQGTDQPRMLLDAAHHGIDEGLGAGTNSWAWANKSFVTNDSS